MGDGFLSLLGVHNLIFSFGSNSCPGTEQDGDDDRSGHEGHGGDFQDRFCEILHFRFLSGAVRVNFVKDRFASPARRLCDPGGLVYTVSIRLDSIDSKSMSLTNLLR